MLFGKEKRDQSESTFGRFSFSLSQKARTPISQSINFSEDALNKVAARKIMGERSSKCTYTTLGLLNICPKGHLIDTSA